MSKVKSYYGGSTSHYYTYNGSTLVQEKIVTSSGQTDYLTFLYNGEGPTGFVLNNTLYTYRKNLFGDIIAVYNGTSKVAEYAYDAYGNCRVITGSNIGTLNPFRYRGYYFDEDMKLYYLQSRYYDPETGRFINADDVSYLAPETIHGLNLYAYCLDNPLRFSPSNSVGKKTATFTSKTASALPKWIDVALTAIDHSFTVINPLRTAIAISIHQNLWDVMRLDGVSELPGALSKVSTGVGWGLGILGGIISGYEKYNTGASLSSSIAGGIINTSISIGGMYAATGIATFAMGLLTATGIPGGIIVVAGAVVSILVGIAINHLLTKLEIAGNTIEGHLNNLLDWIIFWD